MHYNSVCILTFHNRLYTIFFRLFRIILIILSLGIPQLLIQAFPLGKKGFMISPLNQLPLLKYRNIVTGQEDRRWEM